MKAKDLLRQHGKMFIEFSVEEHPVLRDFLKANSVYTVPQVFANGIMVGGYEDLVEWFEDIERWGDDL